MSIYDVSEFKPAAKKKTIVFSFDMLTILKEKQIWISVKS